MSKRRELDYLLEGQNPLRPTAGRKAPLRPVAAGVVEDENGSALVALKEEVADKAFLRSSVTRCFSAGTYASKAQLA
jgi:hypothetical protein